MNRPLIEISRNLSLGVWVDRSAALDFLEGEARTASSVDELRSVVLKLIDVVRHADADPNPDD